MTTADVRAEPVADAPRGTAARRRLTFWLSPAGQPRWARPALLGVAAAGAILYNWGSARPGNIETYYAATVRSMSMSVYNFFFAAFDPAATVTIDKLPGAFWIQALSLRVFGVHYWALVLPQVLEGTATVLVLYRVVRRLAGPVAGIIAAAVLAVSPATVALNRGNISDTLMILLLVLAADATVSAAITGRLRNILLAGVWVGLAFQAKMIEAWLVLPALGLAYLVAAPGDLRRRVIRLGAMGAVTAVVSLSWMLMVTLTPASHRPYVDGSRNDSVFQQVFIYNGFGRIDAPSPNTLLSQSIGTGPASSAPPAWNRLLTGSDGRDTGWLIPAALIAAAAGLMARRRMPRGDLVRLGFIIWGTWLLVFAAVFSVSQTINSYYTAALSPPVAGLIGAGLVLAWDRRGSAAARLVVAGTVLATGCYAAWLLPAAGTGMPSWLAPAVLSLGLAAALAVVMSLRLALRPRVLGATFAAAAAVALIVPAVASASLVAGGLGPFETPFESHGAVLGTKALFDTWAGAAKDLPDLEVASGGSPYLMATQSAVLAAPFIYASGTEVVPIGGYTGTIPGPSLGQLEYMIELGDFHLVLQSPTVRDGRLIWIARHCIRVVTAQPAAPGQAAATPFDLYYCPPQAYGGPAGQPGVPGPGVNLGP